MCLEKKDRVVVFRPGACDLFSREDIDRWEARMNPGRVQADAPAPAPLPEGRYRHPCPTCRKAIPKVTRTFFFSFIKIS